jgi:Single-strand binding protein family
MHATLNEVRLLGPIGNSGVTLRTDRHGRTRAEFQLALTEHGRNGRTYLTLVDCQGWDASAEALRALAPGDVVLVVGKLARRHAGEAWHLFVVGEVTTSWTEAV